MKKAKKINKTRNINKRILILCEDSTSSLLYFKSFKKDDEFKRHLTAVEIEVIHPQDYSPKGLLEEAKIRKKKAKKELNPYDEIWLVFDRDGHKKIPDTFKEAKDSSIKIAFSNKCYEYWVLLHFEYTSKSFSKCADIISHISKNHIVGYEKNKNIFDILKPKMKTAIEYSGRRLEQVKSENDSNNYIEIDSVTNIHELVTSIIGEYLIKK